MGIDIDSLELHERRAVRLEIAETAGDLAVNMARLFHERDFFINDPQLWDDVIDVDENAHYSSRYIVDVFHESSAGLDIIGKFAQEIAAQVQFPLSSTYMAALGVISAAMNERFFVQYNGTYQNSIGLYVIAAQPPSTGKSGVLSILTQPIHEIYAEKRDTKQPIIVELKRKIKRLELKMSKEKCDRTLLDMDKELIALQNEMAEVPNYVWCINDPTAEGCEKVLSEQGGFFNVISDESAAVKVMMGMVYSDRSTNNGIFLKAWDNGFHSVARQSRDGYRGNVRGSFVVLAQESSINVILQAGAEGEGVSERVLMIAEKNLLGERDHTKFEKISDDTRETYSAFCRWLVGDANEAPMPIVFTLDAGAELYLRDMKNTKEPLMKDGAMFSNPLLRGAVGKMDKQIIKIAAILHAAKAFTHAGGKKCDFKNNLSISAIEVQRAEAIVEVLMGTLLRITNDRGITGINAELEACRKKISDQVNSGVASMSFMTFRDSIRQRKEFSNDRQNLSKKLKEEIFPQLQDENYIVWDESAKWVYLNPRLKTKSAKK
jgi:hypothetical protein